MSENRPQQTSNSGKRKAPKTAFKPGVSGNPGGRAKVVGELRDLARTHTATALNTLIELMQHDPNGKVRLEAANAVLDRGYGKPSQSVSVDADVRTTVTKKLADLTDEELAEIAKGG